MLILITFVLLILVGTAALYLSQMGRGTLSFVDALFTATSAVCVTGLVTVPVSAFTPVGQLLILLFIQLGAIGIMTLTASFILFFRGELNFEDRMIAGKLSLAPTSGNVESVVKVVLKYTLAFEALGFLLLCVGFKLDGFSWTDSSYHALFHAVSAFCNAGFSTFDTSLQEVNNGVKLTVMALIIQGGLGYYVLYDLMEIAKKKDRLTVHSKIVLTATCVFIVLGALVLLVTEKGECALIDCFFQSVTARTAGFSTIDLNRFHAAGLLLLIVLMIIGAAPGSTGGGMKLTTFWVVAAAAYNTLRGSGSMVIFKRQLLREDVFRAFAVFFLYLFILFSGAMLLLHYEGGNFLEVLFEITSALGTVGLSLGLTGKLGVSGKVIVIIWMLIGRIGPAILVLLLLREKKMRRVEYPVEKILMG